MSEHREPAALRAGPGGALQRVAATRCTPSGHEARDEALAEETPLALLYNGRPHAVMMGTPADLDDFAVGFSLSEGIVESVDEVEVIDRLALEGGISLQMLIPQRRCDALGARARNLTGRTGCGLCGAATLADAIRPVRRVAIRPAPSQALLRDGFRRLGASQPLNDASGAMHAAAVMTADGALQVREDVGRHNAVDKALGAVARSGRRPDALLVTSRASYELVHKAAQLGCGTVAAISAPTALAVRIAREAGITLIGFARAERMTVYA